jgi:hypothetical protein
MLYGFINIFSAHLMVTILSYTNDLSLCLQRRDQDIINALSLVSVAKNRMQQLRYDEWDLFLQRVTLFCNTHGIQVPSMNGNYVPFRRSARFIFVQTNMITFKEKSILASLIVLFKSLILDLMRLTWSCFIVWQP